MNNKSQGFSFTNKQIKIFESTWQDLLGKSWSLRNPVFILDRCWLRLEKLRFDELMKRLPPDKSGDAPELIKYKKLLSCGQDQLMALQKCWKEFGIEDFHRALRNYWYYQDLGNNGWTFKIYSELLNQYRNSFDNSKLLIPLIILGRKESSEHHLLKWISINSNSKSISLFKFVPK